MTTGVVDEGISKHGVFAREVIASRRLITRYFDADLFADPAMDILLDLYAAERRTVFVERTSPQAVRNKDLIFHANRSPQALEEALAGLRRMAADADFRLQRLMFTRSLETPSPFEKEAA